MSKHVSFLGSIGKLPEAPNHSIPEIAFVGRSNVGKSSLLTMLTGLKKLAPISKTPGRTRRIGFYEIKQPAVCFVDLPGYGYAKLSHEYKKKLSSLIVAYIQTRSQLRGIILLIDARRAQASEEDLAMVELAFGNNKPLLVVMTKSDKLSKTKLGPAQKNVAQQFAISPQAIISVSSTTGSGKKKLWAEINHLLSLPAPEQE